MQDFRDLKVWQKARQLNAQIYKLTQGFPRDEQYCLTSQTRRASVSIVGNIAEGRGFGSDRMFGRHLRTSMGSAYELETYLLVAFDLGYVSEADCLKLSEHVAEVRRMITGFLQTLEKPNKGEQS